MMILVLGGGCIACEFIAEPGTVSHGAHLGGALVGIAISFVSAKNIKVT